MVTIQFNGIKKLNHPKNLENKINNIDDVEGILQEIENYFVLLKSNEDLDFTKDGVTQLSRMKKLLFSILFNVEFSMQQMDIILSDKEQLGSNILK